MSKDTKSRVKNIKQYEKTITEIQNNSKNRKSKLIKKRTKKVNTDYGLATRYVYKK